MINVNVYKDNSFVLGGMFADSESILSAAPYLKENVEVIQGCIDNVNQYPDIPAMIINTQDYHMIIARY